MTGITNCDKKVLHSTTGIAKCDNYYKEWRNISIYLKRKDALIKARVFLIGALINVSKFIGHLFPCTKIKKIIKRALGFLWNVKYRKMINSYYHKTCLNLADLKVSKGGQVYQKTQENWGKPHRSYY